VARLYTDGMIEITFANLPEPLNNLEGWRALAERLQRVDGIKTPPERLGRYPTFAMTLLRHDEQLARFTETIDWAHGEIERATTNQSQTAVLRRRGPGTGSTKAAYRRAPGVALSPRVEADATAPAA
jgi:hypothetical protein